MARDFNVVRHDDGTATFSYDGDTTDDVAAITAEGYWDDATPWDSGSYSINFHNKSNTKKPSFFLENVDNRTGILIHHGTSQRWSEGCLIVSQSFIDDVYDDLRAKGVSTKVGASAGTLNVSGDFGVSLNLAATSSSTAEGDAVQLTVSLTGAGGANGLSKDIYVKISNVGGTAREGHDYQSLSSLPGLVSIQGHGSGWLKIPKGTTSKTISIPTTLDNDDSGTEDPSETFTVSISDYRIANAKTYHDEADILLSGGTTEASIQITNKPSLLNNTVSASGGVDGYSENAQFSPGQEIQINFDPYTIPDRFKIIDSLGQVLVDTGFIGNGSTYNQSIKVPRSGDGVLTIEVLTNDPGTAWTFTVSTVRALSLIAAASLITTSAAGESNLSANGRQFLEALSAEYAPISITQSGDDLLEGDLDTAPLGFSVFLNDQSLEGKSIYWEIIGEGQNPTSPKDFFDTSPLSGSIAIPNVTVTGREVAYIELPSAVADKINEGRETFRVQLRESETGPLIKDAGGKVVSLSFAVLDKLVITPVQQGTTKDDVITGSINGAVINALEGNDVIFGSENDDLIDGGPGNDEIRAAGGNDRIAAGFGDDKIDGGLGLDTLIINRHSSAVNLEETAPGRYTLQDTSLVSLGSDQIVGIERIEFLDKTVVIVTNEPSAPTNIIISSKNVKEHSARGTVVGVLSARDADKDDTFRYQLINDADGRFEIEAGVLKVRDGTRIVFEEAVRHEVAIRVIDDNNLEYTKVFQLEVEKVSGPIKGTIKGDRLIGTESDDTIFALEGNDTVGGGLGRDTISLGKGHDTLRDSLISLHGDTVSDFSYADRIIITGAAIERSRITFEDSINALIVKGDGNNTEDTQIFLEGDFSDGAFMASSHSSNTYVRFIRDLPALEDRIAVSNGRVNGIAFPEYLTGDGVNGFKVSLEDKGYADYDSAIGVYEIAKDGKIVDIRLLFENANANKTASSLITGVESGHKLGFFLVQDAARWAKSLAQDDVFEFRDAEGVQANANDRDSINLFVNGRQVNHTIFHSYSKFLNIDENEHVLSGVQGTGSSLTVGFEDKTGLGDADYEDVVFTVSTVDGTDFV